VVENGVLRLVAHDEGRVVRDGPADKWRFQYFLGDHLGSVRVAFEVHPDTGLPEIVYAADYYPSGLRIDRPELGDTEGVLAARLFSGKEIQDVLGLGWYDFGARMLDPATARWFVPDPAAERYPDVTPYGFVLGNPIRYLERDGRDLVQDPEIMGRRAEEAGAAVGALAGPVVQAVRAGLSMLSTLVGRGPDVPSTTPPTPGKAAGGTVSESTAADTSVAERDAARLWEKKDSMLPRIDVQRKPFERVGEREKPITREQLGVYRQKEYAPPSKGHTRSPRERGQEQLDTQRGAFVGAFLYGYARARGHSHEAAVVAGAAGNILQGAGEGYPAVGADYKPPPHPQGGAAYPYSPR
jgi:RHS repeat-associated protein